jgi:aminoglycoside 3-N-acetyltransferase
VAPTRFEVQYAPVILRPREILRSSMPTKTLQNAKAYAKRLALRCFLAYDTTAFAHVIERLGIATGDVVMVHSSWRSDSGFQGRPVDLLTALKSAVGPSGLIVMPSLTYHNQSSREYLTSGRPMNVRKSASQMGLLSEVFRRGAETRRSLSPSHPLLAWGERAEEFLRDHDKTLLPFGPDSPFGRFLELDGKILTIDAPFSTVTFTHFLEDRIAHTLPFGLYEPESMTGRVIDYEGHGRDVPVMVLSATANRLRREERLVARLEREGTIRKARVGNTRLLMMETRAMTDAVDRMVTEGQSFFDSPVPDRAA